MLASLMLIFVIAFVALQQVITDETFINNQFTKLEIADSMGMNTADLVSSMMVLIHYMEGDVDNIDIIVSVNGQKVPMFELEQEREHMADVRDIYLSVRQYRDMAALALLVLFILAALINFRKASQSLAQGFLFSFFVVLVIFGFIGTWAAMDFSSFWTFFHEALFWNDLWLFDATESRMINMLPEAMFSDIIARMGLYTGLAVGALFVLSILALIFSSDRYKRARAAGKQVSLQRKAYRKNREALLEERKRQIRQAKLLAEKRAARLKAAEKAERERIAEQQAKEAAKQAREKAAAARQQRPGAPKAAPVQRCDSVLPAFPPTPAPKSAPVRRRGSAPTAAPTTSSAPAASAPTPSKAPAPKKKASKSRSSIVDDTGFLDE